MQQSNAMDVSMWSMAPAFLVACFGALRLARFNITAPTKGSFNFQGMPIPATGIFVASIALLNWYAPMIGAYLQKTWILYVIIALLCWLMISKIPFFKFLPAAFNLKNTWRQLVLLFVFIATAIFSSIYVALPFTFIIYTLLSIIIKPSEEQ
jgi:CDP-diacylglycerol--serine O-phosphatidyltransferase